MSAKRRFEAPNEAEVQWIRDNVMQATMLARKYGRSEDTTILPTLADLDRLWVALTGKLRIEQGDPNTMINLIGLAFGQHLVDRLGLEWAIVKDEDGTEVAVHGKRGDVVVFPTNVVAKRWESGEGAFLERLYRAMRSDIERVSTTSPS